jgi:hypothetical protein
MKKTGIVLALGLVLVLASAAAPKANAEVVVSVGVGAPVYVHPVHYRYFVPRPYVAYVPAPVYRRVYVAPAPVYYRHWYPHRYYAPRYEDHWRR